MDTSISSLLQPSCLLSAGDKKLNVLKLFWIMRAARLGPASGIQREQEDAKHGERSSSTALWALWQLFSTASAPPIRYCKRAHGVRPTTASTCMHCVRRFALRSRKGMTSVASKLAPATWHVTPRLINDMCMLRRLEAAPPRLSKQVITSCTLCALCGHKTLRLPTYILGIVKACQDMIW